MIDFFVENEKFIPFGDVQHLNYASRIVRDEKFLASYRRIKERIKPVDFKSGTDN